MRENTRRGMAAAATAAAAAAAVKHEEQVETSYLDFISLPIIRLDEFDQDELRLLAQYSGDFPEAGFQNIVIPKIDRRIFNESAGSRRQTYGKCFASRHWNTVPDNADDTTNEEDSEPDRSRSRGRLRKKQKQRGKVSVAEKTRSAKAVARVIVERKGRLRLRDTANQVRSEARGQSSTSRKVSWIRMRMPPSAASDSSDDSEWTDSAEKVAKATGSVKRGRPKKLASNDVSSEGLKPNGSIVNSRKKQKQEIAIRVEEEYEEELGRRTRKRRTSANYSAGSVVVEDRGSKRRGAIFGRHGEIDQKEDGGRTYFGEEELMETLKKMKGKWSSSQMKRKIVDATGFPKGWTVLVGLRHTKDGRAYFDYRDWRSPEGRIWTSYREAAAYLISTVGKDPCFKGLPFSSACQEDEQTCEQKALDGTSHEVVSSDHDQTFNNGSSLATLLITHGGELFFETETAGDLQSVERSLEQDLQNLERGCEATMGNLQSSGDHVDKFLRVSCQSDDVGISTQAFDGQVTIKMDPSSGEYGEGRRSLLNSEGNLRNWQSGCEIRDLIFNSVPGSETNPEECQSAQEVDGSKTQRESDGDTLRNEPDGRGTTKHLNNLGAAYRCMQTPDLERGHICHLCDMSFPTSVKLRRHLRRSKHLKFLGCDVCGKEFTSITLLLGHRLKMGHPRTPKANRNLSPLPVEVSDSVAKASQSDISNIVLGLLSDVDRFDGGWEADQPSVFKQSTNRPSETARGAGKNVPHILESLKREVGEVAPVQMPNVVYECETCHKIFHHQSKFWGHMSVHSSKKGGVGLASPKSSKGPRTLPVPDGVYECHICHKIFHHQSKYWGHLSIHSNKRKRAPTSSTLHDPESERLGSRMVEEPEPTVRELVSGSNGVEVNHTACVQQHVTDSVFWKLLDDSIPPEGANHEPVPYREEATIRPLASCTKEEAANNEGNIGFRAPLDVNFGPTSGLLQVKSSSSVVSIHSDSLFSHGLLEQKVGETQKIISDMSAGIETIWKQLSEKPPPIDVGIEACPVCRKDDDQPRHLICDWCEKEFHQGCLSPVLHEVPVDWICPFCRARGTETF